jgi:hypothetical protein
MTIIIIIIIIIIIRVKYFTILVKAVTFFLTRREMGCYQANHNSITYKILVEIECFPTKCHWLQLLELL